MNTIEIIGYFAGILTAATMFPQIFKSIRTKKVRDISVYMILMYTVNSLIWVIYGLAIESGPLVLADSLATCAGLTQIYLKIRYYKKDKEKLLLDES